MDQETLIERLATGEGLGGDRPRRIDTHISVIFLTDDRAWKLKRALKTSYLDYSSVDRRRQYCENEVAVNRRTAPDIYLGAVPVRLDADGAISVAEHAEGEIVDWLVCMRRFDDDLLLSRLAEEGPLPRELCLGMGDAIARFHRDAERTIDPEASRRILFVLNENREEIARQAAGILPEGDIARLDTACRETFGRLATVINRRGADGFVRHCLGDMHLRNICVMDGHPVLFDAIEFNEEISHIDVLFDLAFPLMDLIYRGQALAANAVFNRYLYRTRDDGDLCLLPLFLALRAGIRAHTSAMAGDDGDCCGYAALAQSALDPHPTVLAAVSGLSGTGKSTVAARLAPALGAAPGAAVLSSDLIRKRHLGADPLDRLGPEGYTREIDETVYGELFDGAARILAGGHAVILDATFIRPAHREAAAAVAEKAGVPFAGIRLTADAETLLARVRARKNDSSDATEEILQGQLTAPIGPPAWREIDAARPLDEIVADCNRMLLPSPK